MANKRFIDFPIATTVGDNDIILIWQGGANKQTTKATILSGVPDSLNDLTDVTISGLTNGQILRYDSVTGQWENTDQGNLDLNDLNDVTIVSPTNGQVLVYNSSTGKWENSSGGYVPYVGAVTTVNLGAQSIQAGSFVKQGGTASQFLKADGSVDSTAYGTGSVTSVGLTMPAAFNVANSPITTSGTLAVTGAGTVAQYIRGDGSLADFPESSGGGSSVSYYLNGSVDQGTIGGIAYKELSKVPILGAGTDFTINADGYIASFITDAGDPSLLEIPGGNWNFETYFSASSGGGSPTFYVELYKVSSGGTATLIASSSSSPELIAFGTNLNPYFSTLAVPTTTLALTDRLAVRYYVTHSGRTITLHTENNHLCQIVTTFTTGITALNGLTAQVQNFAVGTTGTDFNIASATATHTFNLPTASATNRGALSSADWSLFTQAYNDKINSAAVTGTTTKTLTLTQQDGGTITASWSDLNTDAVLSVFGRTGAVVAANGDYTTAQVTESGNLYYTEARVNANANVAANTAARHNAVTLGIANGLSLSTQVLSLGLASAGVTGALSGSDWSTFNSKQNALTLTTTGTSGAATLVGATLNIPQYQAALTNPVTGTGTTNYLPKFTGSTTIGDSALLDNNVIVSITNREFRIIDNEPQIYLTKTGTDAGIWRILGSTGGTTRRFRIYDETASADRLNITSGGNVLINSISDNGARLQVSGTSSFNGGLNTYHIVSIKSNSVETYGGLGVYSSSNDRFISMNHNGTEGFIETENAGSGVMTPLSFKTGGTTRLTISSTGAATFSSSVTAAELYLSTSNGLIGNINSSAANGGYITWQTSGTTIADLGTAQQVFGSGGNDTFGINARGARSLILGTNNTGRLTISSTGAATFSNTLRTLNDFYAASGTSTAASIRFWDANSGLYHPGSDALGFITSGTQKMVILASGNVGIGTASPNGKLRIQNDNSTIPSLIVRDGGTPTANLIEATSNAYGSSFIVTAIGNVGIGTSSPTNSRLLVAGTHVSGNSILGVVPVGNNVATIGLYNSSGTRRGLFYSDTGFVRIESDADPIQIYAGGVNGINVTTSGNVGIGTPSPNRKLEVITGSLTTNGIRLTYAGGVTSEGMDITYLNTGATTTSFDSIYNSDSAVMQFRMKTAGTPVTALSILGSGEAFFSKSVQAYSFVPVGTNPPSGGMYAIAPDSIAFSTNTTNRLTILGNGNVGIAQQSPQRRLHVLNSAVNNDLQLRLEGNGGNYFDLGRFRDTGAFHIQGNQTGANNICLAPTSGNVLIGTTTSTGAKLEINGDIRTGALGGGYVSGYWKMGRAILGTQPSETYQIIVEINGALYAIGAANL